jgi:5-methylcytosine-specific restriction endonuclease McrA
MSKPSYSKSDGTRVVTAVIDKRVSKAKRELTLEADGCCERCNTNQDRLCWSHIVSIKYAKESGMAELCWDKDNMELLCTKCHLEVESWTAKERIDFYNGRK